MKPQLLKVITPNKIILVKGRLVRSPLTTIIKFENELSLIMTSLRNLDLKYTIEDYVKPVKVDPVKVEPVKVEPVKIKKKEEPKSTLEKIAAENE